jgi:hypothetical protein
MLNWKTALMVLIYVLAASALLETLHWTHIEYCHFRKGNIRECGGSGWN